MLQHVHIAFKANYIITLVPDSRVLSCVATWTFFHCWTRSTCMEQLQVQSVTSMSVCDMYSLDRATDCTHSTRHILILYGHYIIGGEKIGTKRQPFLNIMSQCAVWVRVLSPEDWGGVRVLRVRVQVRVLCIRVRVLTNGLDSESQSLKIWTRVRLE